MILLYFLCVLPLTSGKNQCCPVIEVLESSTKAMYDFKEERQGMAEAGCRDDCVYVRDGEDYCFSSEPTYPVECIDREETVLIIMENGQELKQKTIIDSSSGTITIDVPPHITVLDQNFTQSTTIYNPKVNITITKSNSTCTLSDIPHAMNEYLKQLEKETPVWDGKNKKTVYDLKKVDYVLGPKKRKALMPEMDNLCNNELIKKTETLNINQSQYEKLVNGGIVFIEKEENKQSAVSSNRRCEKKAADVCATGSDDPSTCIYWKNPETGQEIWLHSVTKRNLCTECCVERSVGCNCQLWPDVCPCKEITSSEKFYDCMLKDDTNRKLPIEYNNENSNGPQKRSVNSGPLILYQTLTYNNKSDARSVKIHSPAHGDNEETTVLMHADERANWYGWNNMMVKLGSLCHIRNIPENIKPIDIASNNKQIVEGLRIENSTLTSSNEEKKHFILLNDGSLSAQEEDYLNDEIKEICQNSKLIKYKEVEISQEEFQRLNNGGIIDLKLEWQTEECNTKVTSVASGGWRWPRTRDLALGKKSMVNGLFKSVIQVNCCSKNSGHPSTYCNCEDIIDNSSFERCRPVVIVVIAGIYGNNLHDKFESFKKDSNPGLQLVHLPEKYPFPLKTKQAIGAWINNSLYVCQGFVEGEVSEGDGCFMMKHGAGHWIKPNITILTEPLKYGGASAKYKSGPTGKESGETWWIIGGDLTGTRTQEWNSVSGANPWNPPVLPQPINTPCMVAISDREIFITASPLYETATTDKAWIYSRDYKTGWRIIPSLKETHFAPACGFLPNDHSGWIVVAGGYDKSSTEILDVTKCKNNDWDCAWEYGPDLGSNFYAASMVTMGMEHLVLVGDQKEILAINSTFQNWETIGETSQPRNDAVVLTIPT